MSSKSEPPPAGLLSLGGGLPAVPTCLGQLLGLLLVVRARARVEVLDRLVAAAEPVERLGDDASRPCSTWPTTRPRPRRSMAAGVLVVAAGVVAAGAAAAPPTVMTCGGGAVAGGRRRRPSCRSAPRRRARAAGSSSPPRKVDAAARGWRRPRAGRGDRGRRRRRRAARGQDVAEGHARLGAPRPALQAVALVGGQRGAAARARLPLGAEGRGGGCPVSWPWLLQHGRGRGEAQLRALRVADEEDGEAGWAWRPRPAGCRGSRGRRRRPWRPCARRRRWSGASGRPSSG